MPLENKVNEIYTFSEETYSTERLKKLGCIRVRKYYVLHTNTPSGKKIVPRIFAPYQKNIWKSVEPKSLNIVDAGYKTVAMRSYNSIEDLKELGCEETRNSVNGNGYYVLQSKYPAGVDIIFKKSRSGRWRATPESRRIILEGVSKSSNIDAVLKKLKLV